MKATIQQTRFPLLEDDGVTHRRDCDCSRCDAGFRPSEAQRLMAASRWEARQEEKRAREAADAALARKRQRDRARAIQAVAALRASRTQVDAFLAEQTALGARVAADESLSYFLRLRGAGRPMAEALAETSRRFSPKRAPART